MTQGSSCLATLGFEPESLWDSLIGTFLGVQKMRCAPLPNRQPLLHCYSPEFRYIPAVNRLTRQEQVFLCIVLGLLLSGWAVKAYRAAPHGAQAAEPAKP